MITLWKVQRYYGNSRDMRGIGQRRQKVKHRGKQVFKVRELQRIFKKLCELQENYGNYRRIAKELWWNYGKCQGIKGTAEEFPRNCREQEGIRCTMLGNCQECTKLKELRGTVKIAEEM